MFERLITSARADSSVRSVDQNVSQRTLLTPAKRCGAHDQVNQNLVDRSSLGSESEHPDSSLISSGWSLKRSFIGPL